VFEETIGDLEAILGDEMNQLSRVIYTKDLSPDEQIELSNTVATSILRRKQDLEEFDKHKMEFLGQDFIFEQDINSAIDTGRYVAPQELLSLVRSFAGAVSPGAVVEKNQGDDSYVVIPNQGLEEYLKRELAGAEFADEASRTFRARIRSKKEIPCTFTDSVAYERKAIEYIHLRHALTRVAIEFWLDNDRGEYPVLSATVCTGDLPPGDYLAFLFAMRIEALRSQERMLGVIVDPSTMSIKENESKRFLRIIQDAGGPHRALSPNHDWALLEEATQIAVSHIASIRDETEQEQRQRNSALVEMRLASLDQTYQSKGRLFKRYLESATDPRIRRMREGQIRNLEGRHHAEREKVERRRRVEVTFALKLAAFFTTAPAFSQDDEAPDASTGNSDQAPEGSIGPIGINVMDKKCPHGVPKISPCNICDPKGFREATGIG